MPEQKERSCGNCTACCKTHAVFEIDKMPGQWCKYCEKGKGCRKYNDRPGVCKEFRCEWIKGYGERPDRTKVVIDFHNQGAMGNLAQLWEVSEGALGRPYATRIRSECLGGDVCVCYMYLDGRKEMFVPPGFFVSPALLARLNEEGIKLFKTKGISIAVQGLK
ncbi:MAG: hypothetical protein CO042_03390 [Parcubacteria group bacterium CG_4_9_14_0_2_um_filter_41_8]|nr:MAG: hypothetical protein COU72_03820 [Parcubacteria group bacterium CG10_big_fil_rev_8_21_14_0_10_41_35]PJC40513.1 MAG: hypothetical protein CO042_03390 [Parcubacteria group bacterium CG_4_9_14_0_2_um_filter_41_8]